MTNIVSRLSVHQEHELLLKLESAGLNDQLAQLVIDSKQNKLAKQVVEFLQNGSFASEETQSTPAQPQLLEFLRDVEVAGSEQFVVADHYKTENEAGVKFWDFGDNFKENFFSKVEENIPTTNLRSFKLKKSSLDGPIRAELGNDAKEETTLAYLWELLKKQPKGESGDLLTNGYANIFYIRGTSGILWAVDAYWSSVGWVVDAGSVGYRYGWDAGSLVFGR